MVQCCRALLVGRRGLPVVAEWSTPHSEVEDQHDNVRSADIDSSRLDDEILCEVLCQPPVEQQKTGFAAPLYGTHALFHQKDRLASPPAFVNFVWCQDNVLCRIDQVRADVQVDVQKHDQDGVKALTLSMYVIG